MKLLFALIMVLALALWTIVPSGQVFAFFNSIASSLGNTVASAKIFTPREVSLANHVVINEVLYDTIDSQDIYKQEGKTRGQWVEIYNPTANPVDLTGWSLEDNSGASKAQKLEGVVPQNSTLLLISIAQNDFKSIWSIPSGVVFVEANLGKIGNGLDPLGDTLVLKDKDGNVVDKMSWGKDASGFSPSCKNLCSTAPSGESLKRSPAANDTDKPSDFISNKTPSPGRSIE